MTPATVGPFIVPAVGSETNRTQEYDNVNKETCGGQATIPIVKAISSVVEVKYAEIVATISSKSAGTGTRQNIDEFTQTTARAIKEVGGAKYSKAHDLLGEAKRMESYGAQTIYIVDSAGAMIMDDVKEKVSLFKKT